MKPSETDKILHQALIKSAVMPKRFGICSLVLDQVYFDHHHECMERLRQLMRAWPKYSGNSHYPVPLQGFNPEYAYDYAYNTRWDPTTEYGSNRLELFEFLLMETGKNETI